MLFEASFSIRIPTTQKLAAKGDIEALTYECGKILAEATVDMVQENPLVKESLMEGLGKLGTLTEGAEALYNGDYKTAVVEFTDLGVTLFVFYIILFRIQFTLTLGPQVVFTTTRILASGFLNHPLRGYALMKYLSVGLVKRVLKTVLKREMIKNFLPGQYCE